jgi:hypothetical protein
MAGARVALLIAGVGAGTGYREPRPSRLLRAGDSYLWLCLHPNKTCTMRRWCDNAGAAFDAKPPDHDGTDSTGAVWVAHQHANAAHNCDIWVAQIFGPEPLTANPAPADVPKKSPARRP